jgi:hypothetical protein
MNSWSIPRSKYFRKFDQQKSWSAEESRIVPTVDISKRAGPNWKSDSRSSTRIAASAEPGIKVAE